jgi:SagB-type dehydrogenase family enzyme
VSCGPVELGLVAGAERGTRPEVLVRELDRLGNRAPAATLAALVRAGVLVPLGTDLARREARWRSSWKWGPVAGAHHLGLRNVRFRSQEETEALLARRALRERPVAVLPRRRRGGIALPAPRVDRGVLPHLLARRTLREMSGEAIGAQEIADVLFAGLGVRGLVRDPVQGVLPLKLAPSGGARNPIDGYLCAIQVAGVAPGAYLYSGVRRDLDPIRPARLPPAPDLLGGQPWADGAAAVVFLVASFGRAMWKYRHPLSYRMVLLEAGHIAQNLLVAACDLGLAAWPSGAISDSLCEEVLGTSSPDRSVLYAVVLGRPAPAPQRPRRARSARNSATGG